MTRGVRPLGGSVLVRCLMSGIDGGLVPGLGWAGLERSEGVGRTGKDGRDGTR